MPVSLDIALILERALAIAVLAGSIPLATQVRACVPRLNRLAPNEAARALVEDARLQGRLSRLFLSNVARCVAREEDAEAAIHSLRSRARISRIAQPLPHSVSGARSTRAVRHGAITAQVESSASAVLRRGSRQPSVLQGHGKLDETGRVSNA
jgi:hypothetical protein